MSHKITKKEIGAKSPLDLKRAGQGVTLLSGDGGAATLGPRSGVSMIDVATFQKYSLFGGVLPEEIERIKPLFEYANYDVGAVIIREGEPNDRIHFIVEGKVAVTRRGVKIVEYGEGDEFGEMELLDVMPSAATVRAVAPTRVAMITNRAIHEIYRVDLKAFALIIMNLARDLSRRLRHMDEILKAGK